MGRSPPAVHPVRLYLLTTLFFAALVVSFASGCRPFGGTSPAPLHSVVSSSPSAVRLVDQATEAGLRYRWSIPGPRPLTIGKVMGSGCGFLDYDGDGNLDILLVGPKLALYKGDGKGHFTDVTAAVDLDRFQGDFTGCAVGDYDNDGYDDIYISGYHAALLLHNEGGHSFRDVTTAMGLKPQPWGTSVLFADLDGDGRIDLFVCNYVEFGPKTQPQLCRRGEKKIPTSCPPHYYRPLKGVLYHNEGSRFVDATAVAGLDKQTGGALGVASAHCGEHGEVCLYVANDERDGDLFDKGPDGRFVNVAAMTGTARDTQGRVHAGMGVDWGDYDNDGLQDLFVTTFSSEIKNVYRNRGGYFEDRSEALGVQSAALAQVGFGTKWVDLNNDGFLDLVLCSGHVRDNVAAVTGKERYRQPVQALISQGGSRFVEAALSLPLIVGRGLATGDYDNDGKVDVLVVDGEGAPLLLHNETQNAGNYLDIRLVGKKNNRDGIGALVTVTLPGGNKLQRECQTGGSYLSSSDRTLHFGLGAVGRVDAITIAWPNGRVQRETGSDVNRRLTITER